MAIHTAETLAKAFGYLFPKEVPFLKELVKAKAKEVKDEINVLNIGAGSGTSGLAFYECSDRTRVTTIDVRFETHPLGGIGNERQVIQAYDASLSRWSAFHGKSENARYDAGTFDIVFVDGDHTEEGCIADVERAIEWSKDGAFIVIHDYDKVSAWEDEHGRPPTDEEIARLVKPIASVDRAVEKIKKNKRLKFYKTVASSIAFRVLPEKSADEKPDVEKPTARKTTTRKKTTRKPKSTSKNTVQE